jgi:hypothetical protein
MAETDRKKRKFLKDEHSREERDELWRLLNFLVGQRWVLEESHHCRDPALIG